MKVKTVLISNTVRIDTARIPNHVAQNIAQVALRGIQEAYADPAVQADFRRWKAAREAQHGKESN